VPAGLFPGESAKISRLGLIFARFWMLNQFPTQYGQSYLVWSCADRSALSEGFHRFPDSNMRITPLILLLLSLFPLLAMTPARADLRITSDHGGYVSEYKEKYQRIRDRHERVIIDGVCNSACTLVFGIVPLNKICVTPRASVGFHQAYYDKAFTFGIKVTSAEGTADLMSYYPNTVKDWIRRNGGLTTEMKKIRNGVDLWQIVDPCPEEF
jgi:hypothetical protein